jgi:recombination protein RecA
MKRIKLKSDKDSDLRKRLKSAETIVELKKPLYFIDSGSWTLNLALTNNVDHGYPVGRVINPIGDYSTGKTLLACEAVNSVWYHEHLIKKKKVKIYYDEPEHAFDHRLAVQFKMPLEHIIGLREDLTNYKRKKGEKPFNRSRTVEDMYNNLDWISKNENNYDIIVYIIDSLDTLKDAREIKHLAKKGIEKQDMGGSKARVLSQLFRNCIEGINNSNILLIILSQIRKKIGIAFGDPNTRAGGKALDHYANSIFQLREIGKIQSDYKMNQGIEVGVRIKKNKTGSRYNDVEFAILHGWGIDNFTSAVNFLWDNINDEIKIKNYEKAHNMIKFQGEKVSRQDLIEICAEDKAVANIIKTMLQDCWNQMVEQSEIKRKPKWGG